MKLLDRWICHVCGRDADSHTYRHTSPLGRVTRLSYAYRPLPDGRMLCEICERIMKLDTNAGAKR